MHVSLITSSVIVLPFEDILIWIIAIILIGIFASIIIRIDAKSRTKKDSFTKYDVGGVSHSVVIDNIEINEIYQICQNYLFKSDFEPMELDYPSYISFKHEEIIKSGVIDKFWEKYVKIKLSQMNDKVKLEIDIIPSDNYKEHPTGKNPLLAWPKYIINIYELLNITIDGAILHKLYPDKFILLYIDDKRKELVRAVITMCLLLITGAYGWIKEIPFLPIFSALLFMFVGVPLAIIFSEYDFAIAKKNKIQKICRNYV